MPKLLSVVSLLLFLLFGGTAEALTTGKWKINGNGFVGDLVISAVSPTGQLSGTVYGQRMIGFWNEAAQKIVFMRIISAPDPSTFQIFTGYLFRSQGGSDVTYTLAGSFIAFAGTGATAARTEYGWYATIFVVG